jgi:hypothetical protein
MYARLVLMERSMGIYRPCVGRVVRRAQLVGFRRVGICRVLGRDSRVAAPSGFGSTYAEARTAECDVCTVPCRARSGGRASWPFTGVGTIFSTDWLVVICLRAGYERDSSAVVVGTIGFTIEYFISDGAASFCLFVTPSPSRQPTGLFAR